MSKTEYLTKSAFLLGLTCPTKLYYLSHGYPNANEEDEYLALLAEGGFIIGSIAQFLFPDGKQVPRTGNPLTDFESTKREILAGDVTLFEATALSNRKLVIADVIERKGDVLRITEVKSKSFDSSETKNGNVFRGAKGKISTDWLEYLYDITYQHYIFSLAFPNFEIQPRLLLVDKAKRIGVNALPGKFKIHRDGALHSVEIRGDLQEVSTGTSILTTLSVREEVNELLPFVKEQAGYLENVLSENKKVPPALRTKCRDCEFRGEELSPSGYEECWEQLPRPEHHIFDLFYGTTLKADGELLFDRLLSEKKCSLFDIPLEALSGKRGERQRIQIECTQKNEEWYSPALFSFQSTVRYPLHFIDFETTRTAVPYHSNLRPFEQIAFQWSCHTVEREGDAPIHTEWINLDPEFPNFSFAKSLKDTLSSDGTVFTWGAHESIVISDIIEQSARLELDDPTLVEFLRSLVSSKGSLGRLVDMNRLTIDNYFHPEMGGRTSIKKVFPAIWRSNAELRSLPWFKQYECIEEGKVVDPYMKLPPLLIGGVDVSVKEGTAAMRAYEEMIFGEASNNPEEKEKWRRLLLQYCKLDTLAMVVIWQHWLRAKRE